MTCSPGTLVASTNKTDRPNIIESIGSGVKHYNPNPISNFLQYSGT